MIIIARPYGQLGNRLFLYAHFIAAAQEYGIPLLNPSFAEYANLFQSTRPDLWCRYTPRDAGSTHQTAAESQRAVEPPMWKRRWLSKAIYLAARGRSFLPLGAAPTRVIRLAGDESCDLGGKFFQDCLRSNSLILAQGWRFRSESLLEKHSAAVRDHLRIVSKHQRRVNTAIASLREATDIVVGIHIRHGDYATFMNGRYFYPTGAYAEMMRRIAARLPGYKVRFLVCGNGQLNAQDFSGLQVQFGPGHLVEDLYTFARCDLIIGPPSTYTGWAAFYGDTTLIEWRHLDQPIAQQAAAVVDRPQAA